MNFEKVLAQAAAYPKNTAAGLVQAGFARPEAFFQVPGLQLHREEVVMELARVAGQVVATVRSTGLPHNSLLLVDLLDAEGNPSGRRDVALDTIGAGEGEWVILVRGSAASRVCSVEAPLDLAVVGIVDQVSCRAKTIYSKS